MSNKIDDEIDSFLAYAKTLNGGENEFLQAVGEVATSIMPWYVDQDAFRRANLLERMCEPDRVISFRVPWETDDGEIRFNRAWRVQFNRVLGPYKGGIRFSTSVNQSVLKFLGFEQTFKNALTGLPMGGAKGGANFDPKGKSEREISRFCQSLMSELHRHIGPDIDVPAGDIGVGAREISVLFGSYIRLANRWNGVLTGKRCDFGGSAVRKEATGYGCIYFLEAALAERDEDISKKTIAISGSGNVALYAAEKAIARGACVLTMSDSDGFAFFENGLTKEQFERLKKMKEDKGGRLSEFSEDEKGVSFHTGCKPWNTPCDIAMPCATQNEINEDDASRLVENGVTAVCEGANMPTTNEAAKIFRESDVLHAPAKAANAGGVAVSGLELSQNAIRQSWSREEVDERLKKIMKTIHSECVNEAGKERPVNYVDAANLASFKRVANTMHKFDVY